jgi:hypothetical protein
MVVVVVLLLLGGGGGCGSSGLKEPSVYLPGLSVCLSLVENRSRSICM